VQPGTATTRNPLRFNAVTGLSERKPFEDTNVIHYWPVSLRPLKISWQKMSRLATNVWSSPWAVANRYYRPQLITRIALRLTGQKRWRLIRDESAELSKDAGERIRKRLFASETDKLRNLARARNTSYLIVRGMPSVPWLIQIPNDAEFPEEQKQLDANFVRGTLEGRISLPPEQYEDLFKEQLREKRDALNDKLRNTDFVAAALSQALGCTIRPRYEGNDQPLARNLISDPAEPQTSDLDNLDIALRFQQSTVEKALPGESQTQAGTGETCLYRLYLCMRNLCQQPVYLITVREVIEQHLCPNDPKKKAEVIALLQEKIFYERRPPRPRGVLKEQWQPGGPILQRKVVRDGETGTDFVDWLLSFDQERVRAVDVKGAEPIHELREAIRRARREAIRIDMRSGDILIVDNLRAMVSRREHYVVDFSDLLLSLLSLVRWSDVWCKLPDGKWIHGAPSRWHRLSGLFRRSTQTEERLKQVVWWPFRPHRWLRAYYLFRAEKH
jgi:hypothetical protein